MTTPGSAARYTDRVFGTEISVVGLARPGPALEWLHELERVCSRFDPASDLSRLNRDRDTVVSTALVQALLAAVDAAAWTGGLVSPFLGAEVVRLGYDRTFDELAATTSEPLAPVDPQGDDAVTDGEVIVDQSTGRIVLPDGVDIDLGGFLKGWAADEIAVTDGSGRGLVNLGGDIRLWSDGEPWTVGATAWPVPLRLTAGGVATSSTLRRRWRRGGRSAHHVIDPRTGHSTRSDCIEATVTAATGLAAEVGAKYAIVAGLAAAQAAFAAQPGWGWTLTATDGSTVHHHSDAARPRRPPA